MEGNELIKKLEMIIKNKKLCRIERNNIDKYKKSCNPIKFSNEFLLLCYEYDFEFDGFEIVKLKDISNVIYDDVDIFINNIFEFENIELPKDYAFVVDYNIDSFKTIFDLFFCKNENIIIECEMAGEFYIGKIINVYEEYVLFLGFDCGGIWEKEEDKIFYKDITSISFGNRYLKYMSKYVHNEDKKI